jgi:hypothetical protein
MNSCIRSAVVRKIMLMMLLVPAMSILLSAGHTASASADTTWSVSLRLNMTKAVNQHIFYPDSDYVYIIMDHGIQPFRLVPGPGYTYTGTLFDELDSGITYHYKFRINDSVWETVNRSVTAQPGMVTVTAWWNDEPINYTSFTVNMKYAVQYGLFNPASDTVCIVGTMNNMQGSPRMQRIDTTLNYTYTYSLDPGSIQQYKYRINADSSGLELLYKPARTIRVPDTLLELTNDFNNFNPAKRLMTFHCNMEYFVRAHHFYPSTDFLDLAGNFDDWGANDVLFDLDGDTIYTLEKYIDTTWFHQGSLEFKFRVNGSWNAAELSGKPNRTYAFHDTINQNPNVFTCYYNNLDPSIPTPPWVYDVAIQGQLIHKKILSGVYSYENVNGIPEDSTTYRWYSSPDATGSTLTPIDSAWYITYTVDTLDIGKWLVFEVTPRAASGDSAVGLPVRAISTSSISAWDVGMVEQPGLINRVYPNPAVDFITIETRKEMERIDLINYLNQPVLVKEDIGSKTVRLQVGYLPRGLYLLKATTKSRDWGVVRVVKL